jgi:hypothetical protein
MEQAILIGSLMAGTQVPLAVSVMVESAGLSCDALTSRGFGFEAVRLPAHGSLRRSKRNFSPAPNGRATECASAS